MGVGTSVYIFVYRRQWADSDTNEMPPAPESPWLRQTHSFSFIHIIIKVISYLKLIDLKVRYNESDKLIKVKTKLTAKVDLVKDYKKYKHRHRAITPPLEERVRQHN
jgi:hypothetical protein